MERLSIHTNYSIEQSAKPGPIWGHEPTCVCEAPKNCTVLSHEDVARLKPEMQGLVKRQGYVKWLGDNPYLAPNLAPASTALIHDITLQATFWQQVTFFHGCFRAPTKVLPT